MKKYILSLFALLVFLTPVVSLSANELTDPGTVDGERQSPLYRLFYKEHRITSNDSIAYEDSDGTEYSFNDIFESADVPDSDTDTNNSSITISDSLYTAEIDTVDEDLFGFRFEDTFLDDDALYYSFITVTDASDNLIGEDFSIYHGGNVEILENDFDIGKSTSYHKGSTSDDGHRFSSYDADLEDGDNFTIDVNKSGVVSLAQFETAPSKSEMDTYNDVYLTVEEGETYYYYTFDGGFISILWVAVLFSGSYLYIRKAEVEDTKQAMVQASIFFIIGLVLLRVIQTVI